MNTLEQHPTGDPASQALAAKVGSLITAYKAAGDLQVRDLREPRTRFLKEFRGTLSGAASRLGINGIRVTEGIVRNRLTGTEYPEHSLAMWGMALVGRSSVSQNFLSPVGRYVRAEADFVTGIASYASYSSNFRSYNPPLGSMGLEAWESILEHVSDLSAFLRDRVDHLHCINLHRDKYKR